MASFTKHNDKWRAHVFKHGVRATKVLNTKREAQAWALKKEAELDSFKGSGGRTLLTAVTHYLSTVSPTKREGALEWERRRFDAMLNHFGETATLASIDSEAIGKWRDRRLETVSGSTVQRESNLLRHLFTLATDEWRWIDRNPFNGVRLPKENEARHQLWRWQQIRRVLRAGQRSGGKTGEVAEAFHIALRTGMRLSEVLRAPAAFDPRRRVVTIRTKTSSRDEVPVGRVAAKLLSRPPFTVGPNEASALFSRLTRSQLVEGLTFHDARATALTLLARKVDVMVLARISRHRDISLLHRVYYRTSAQEIAAKL
jgi:integrase